LAEIIKNEITTVIVGQSAVVDRDAENDVSGGVEVHEVIAGVDEVENTGNGDNAEGKPELAPDDGRVEENAIGLTLVDEGAHVEDFAGDHEDDAKRSDGFRSNPVRPKTEDGGVSVQDSFPLVQGDAEPPFAHPPVVGLVDPS
jgi:hypothetical protein